MEGQNETPPQALPLERKHPAPVVLRALLGGLPIVDPKSQEEWRYEDGVFGIVRESLGTQTGESQEVVIGVDQSVASFIKWCERLPEETIVNTVFNLTLRSIRKPR